MFNGLQFALLVSLLGYAGVKNQWAKLGIVTVISWAMAPLVVQIAGKWRLRTQLGNDDLRKWRRTAYVGGWITGCAAIITITSLAEHFRNFAFSSVEPRDIEEFGRALMFRVLPAVAVLAGAISVLTKAAEIRKELGDKDQDLWL
jgi:hypothetical protein